LDTGRTTRLCLIGLLALCAACATVPDGRYGVDDLTFEGVEQLDEFALRSCLATREREWLSIDLSKSPAPACGEPPFDAKRIHLPLWVWPWAEWPLYEPSVFDRDLARIERWYRARGYYGARILSADADPPEALYGTPTEQREMDLRVRVEEGQPVLIRGVQLEGVGELDAELGATLLDQLDALSPDERFDESTFELTKHTLVRTLRNAGYASAEVNGHVDIQPAERAADIRMTVVPGAASVFGSVCVEGYESLPAKLILEASDIAPGRPFSERDLEDARTRIYQMRVFSEVEIIAGRRDPKTGASTFAEEANLRQGEWAFDPSRPLPEVEREESAERTCRLSKKRGGKPQIPIDIRVKPGRLYRWGVGAGLQIGVEDGQRAITAAQQWDVHLFAFGEIRNFLGGLRRLRIEERPRLVFLAPFPRTISPTNDEREIKLGNNLSALLEWPAFLEARTLLRLTSAWDRGPDPFGGGFIRDDIDVGLGPSRGFFRNRLFASAAVHFNPYIPREVYDASTITDDNMDGKPDVLRDERYNLLFLQQSLEWDQRDDKTSPHRGRYLRFGIDETLPPSNWYYVRITPEAREYIALPYGLVLAGRFGIGLIHIYETSDYYRHNNSRPRVEELERLGPRPYRLRGGGPYSVRGRQSGELGLRQEDLDGNTGFPGGTRSWIGSLELRVPLGDSFGIAVFGDAGDVDGGSKGKTASFRFDRPNTTLGGGLRYKTIVGPVRLDIGWLVPGLQGNSEPIRKDPLFRMNGAVHLTIGEAF
jgi:outer membrane protein assembly factor BamA